MPPSVCFQVNQIVLTKNRLNKLRRSEMEKFVTYLGIGVVALVLITLVALVFAFPTLWLWNWLMPSIFGLTKITFWQALGINILSGLLFKSNINTKS